MYDPNFTHPLIGSRERAQIRGGSGASQPLAAREDEGGEAKAGRGEEAGARRRATVSATLICSCI